MPTAASPQAAHNRGVPIVMNPRPLAPMNAFILTGGKSTRMKREKALLTLDGRTFIDILAGRLAGLFGKVFTVGKAYGSELITGNVDDRVEGVGPLAGIQAALEASDRECNFIIGIDYPFLSPRVVLALSRFLPPRTGVYDGVVPVAPDGRHPLFAFYRRRSLHAVERCIREGRYQILSIDRYAKIRYVDVLAEIPGLEKGEVERIFSNVNEKVDYRRVKYFSKKSKGLSGKSEI